VWGFQKMELQDIDLSELHDCKKCHGKIVSITIDKMGVERCAYCNQVVPYRQFIENKLGISVKIYIEKKFSEVKPNSSPK